MDIAKTTKQTSAETTTVTNVENKVENQSSTIPNILLEELLNKLILLFPIGFLYNFHEKVIEWELQFDQVWYL